jgi:hypothetical protein
LSLKQVHPHKKDKCAFGRCEHKTELLQEEFHDEGLCWKITQEEFKDNPTNAKYCPCAKQPNFIRRYDRVGYMERDQHDQMITRPCARCGVDCLFTIHDTLCMACKTRADYNPDNP